MKTFNFIYIGILKPPRSLDWGGLGGRSVYYWKLGYIEIRELINVSDAL